MIGRMPHWSPSWSKVRERVAVDLLRWTPKGTLSRGIGWAARRRVPKPLRRALYGGFARYVGADLSLPERPLDAFERFDDIFTRALRDGSRPIAEGQGVVASPCGGVVSEVARARGGRIVLVHAVGSEGGKLEEIRAGIDEPVDALAGGHLAALAVFFGGLRTAAGPDRDQRFAQFGHEARHALEIPRVVCAAPVQARFQQAHGRRFSL